MIIECPECNKKFQIDKNLIPTNGRTLQCGSCDHKWFIEFITEKTGINPLMGWESSTDTYSELKLQFDNKELAIEYAKKNNILFEVIEPQNRKITKKSYADNFIK